MPKVYVTEEQKRQAKAEEACQDVRELISKHVGTFMDSARFGKKKKRLTQDEAAKQIGMRKYSFVRLENGGSIEIDLDTFIKALPTLGLYIGEIGK